MAVIAVVAAALAAAVGFASPASAARGTQESELVPVLFVGNNWDGTADVIRQGGTQSQPTFERVARLNVIPDID